MSIQEIIQQARTFSVDEQKQLIKALVDIMGEPSTETVPKLHSLREFKGVGAHLYDGTDAQEYVSKLRSEWDDRP